MSALAGGCMKTDFFLKANILIEHNIDSKERKQGKMH